MLCEMLCRNQCVWSSIVPHRQICVSYGLKKSHYDTLGITPNATMTDIKKAYYNLSMVYHPDKSDGSPENLEKFRAVTEAYEVLSNLNSKKLYDKGVLRASPVQKPIRPYPKKKTYVPQEAGRTPIYNFELWSRAHYGESIARRASAKSRYNESIDKKQDELDFDKVLSTTVSLVMVVFVGFLLAEISGNKNDNIDTVKTPPQE